MERTRMAQEDQNQRWNATMLQEDQTQKHSNSGGGGSIGGRSSKKQKQKKVPQRGLGVAQLEKIRLEEQQKDAAAVAAATIFSSPSSISPSSFLSPTLPNYHTSNQSSASIPFPQSPTYLSSPNSIFRPPLPIQNLDIRNSGTVPLVNQVNNGGFEMGWLGISVPGHGNVPKLWNSCEYNLEKENSGVDPGLVFHSNLSLPYESNPIWPLPGLVQRTPQYQQPSSIVNVSSANSSSSVLNFQIEPPSNQSYYSNYAPMWPEEEKMIGMKRPYPFSLDNPPGPTFNYKFPTTVHPTSKSDEAASCGNGDSSNFETGNPIFREGPTNSTSISKPNSKKSIKENGVSNGDFLTLALPASSSMSQSKKFKPPSPYLASHNREFPVFGSLPYRGSREDQNLRLRPSVSNQQQPVYSFFPPAKAQIGHASTAMNNCNAEAGENVDLNLKL